MSDLRKEVEVIREHGVKGCSRTNAQKTLEYEVKHMVPQILG